MPQNFTKSQLGGFYLPTSEWLKRFKSENPEKYRVFRDKVNQRRHERYRTEPEYRERMKKQVQSCRRKYHEKWREYSRAYRERMRQRAMETLGGTKCVYCGCDILDFLEINHKNPIGRRRNTSPTVRHGGVGFWSLIVHGKVDTANLEVACRVCNALHYLRHRYGETGHRVIWNARQNQGGA